MPECFIKDIGSWIHGSAAGAATKAAVGAGAGAAAAAVTSSRAMDPRIHALYYETYDTYLLF